jgi:uncharacterized membrane protein SpoIIM required for sporulation
MTPTHFIQTRREHWQQLESLLVKTERRRLRALTRMELKRLGQLYRILTTDLAYAQTNFPNSDLVLTLNQLASRTHPYVYRGESFTFAGVLHFFRNDLPQTFRANIHYFALSATIFLVAGILGAIAVFFNEEAAGIVISPTMIDYIHRHEMWTDHLFSVIPSSVASAKIFTNNISVAFSAFALGLTFGVGTFIIITINGLMLGCILMLCARYGMLGPLLEFITAHGVVEISTILIAGAAGLMVGTALLNPGDYTRRDSLAIRGADAVKLVLGVAPILVVIGLVEGFISPQPGIPAEFKMALGVFLGVLLYLHLFLSGRKPATANRAS